MVLKDGSMILETRPPEPRGAPGKCWGCRFTGELESGDTAYVDFG